MRLIERARKGDAVALQELLERRTGKLRARVQRRMGEALRKRVDVSDIMQSTYIDVVRGISTFEGDTEKEFSGWVAAILENNIRNKARYYRAVKRDRARETTGHDLVEFGLPSEEPTPSGVVSITEELSLVGAAMARLRDDYARVLLVQTRADLDAEARAKTMGRTQGATRVLLARARAALLTEMERVRRERDEL